MMGRRGSGWTAWMRFSEWRVVLYRVPPPSENTAAHTVIPGPERGVLGGCTPQVRAAGGAGNAAGSVGISWSQLKMHCVPSGQQAAWHLVPDEIKTAHRAARATPCRPSGVWSRCAGVVTAQGPVSALCLNTAPPAGVS